MPPFLKSQALPAVVFVPAMLLAFASLPLFAFGMSDRAEPLVLAAHAAAALATLALAWRAVLGDVARDDLLLAMPPAMLALWSMLPLLWQDQPLLILLGAPQSGQGALWYFGLAVWLILAQLAVRDPSSWRRLTDLAALVGWVIAALTFGGRFADTPPLILVTSYYGWLGLALLPMILRHRGGPLWHPRVVFVLGAAAALLLASKSFTLVAAAIGGLSYAVLALRLGTRLPLLQARAFGLAILATAALLPFIVVASGLLNEVSASMRARHLVIQMILMRLRDEPALLLAGQGWGRTADAFATHLDGAVAPLWNREAWDFLSRDYFHSHNLLTETVLATGLPGLLFALGIPAALVWCAPARRRGYAIGFASAWLFGLGLWFELAFSLPAFALATAALCHDPAHTSPLSGRRLRIFVGFGLAVALLQLVAVGLLALQGLRIETAKAWLSVPHGPPPTWHDLRGDDRALAALTSLAMNDLRERVSGNAPDIVAETRRIDWMIDLLSERMAHTQNPALPVVGDTVFAEIVLNPALAPLQSAFAGRLSFWPLWLDRGLTLAPRRSDLPIGYLSWRLAAGDYLDVLVWSRRLLSRDTEDPVGLYFEGGVMVLQPDAESRQRGLALLRRAIDRGIERYIQLDPVFVSTLRATQP
jgi:hypothetical protein